MTGAQHLLPGNRTRFEEALSEALDVLPALSGPVEDVRGFRYAEDHPAWLGPWLAVEYGLGDIASYFGDSETLVAEGVAWQRLRGTPAAIAAALGWIGYEDITLLDQWPWRFNWHRYQIEMGELPGDDEVARLMDAEYLAGLSDPARSEFFRGFHGYDVPTLDFSGGTWGNALWGDNSGVRLPGGAVKWSHGRDHDLAFTATEGDLETLGIDVENGDPIGWGDFPWSTPGVGWAGILDAAAFRSFLVRRMPAYVGLYAAGGDPIGFRRCGIPVDLTEGDETATIRFEARTGFGDGAGGAVASVALVLNARNADTTKPGKLWLEPDEIEALPGSDLADTTLGPIALALVLRETVREHITITVDF